MASIRRRGGEIPDVQTGVNQSRDTALLEDDLKRSAGFIAAMAITAAIAVPTMSADAAGKFRLRNVATGQCLQWNGDGNAITLAACSTATKQYWANAADHLVTFATPFVGDGCLTGSYKHEGWAIGAYCSNMPANRTSWSYSSLSLNTKTILWNPIGGYLKAPPSSGPVLTGASVSGDKDLWQIIS